MTGGEDGDRSVGAPAGEQACERVGRLRLSPTAVVAATSPLVLASLVVLVVNDHVAKARWPGPVTGIASDVAGLVLLPVVLALVVDLARDRPPTARLVLWLGIVVAAGFAAVELVPAADAAYERLLGLVGWPVRWLAGGSPGTIVEATPDPADLLALPAALVGAAVWSQADRETSHPTPPRPPATVPNPIEVAS